MSALGAFDAITKMVGAAGGLAAAYTFVTKNLDDVVPVTLSLMGLAYEVLLGLLGLVIVVWELRYWRGPVVKRPSHEYRVMLTRPAKAGVPTNWEILGQARRRDQVLTILFGLFCTAFLGAIMAFNIDMDLEGGFPVRSPSVTWLSGAIALVAIGFIASKQLRSLLADDRVPRGKKRCGSCGELASKQARMCHHCQERFPSGILQLPHEAR